MPSTKVIKPKPVETKTPERPKPVKVRAVNGAQSELRVPAVRKSRASSCPRCPQRGDRCPQRTCETRTRSSSTAPRTAATNRVKHAAVLNPKGPEVTACGPREQRGSVRAETKQIQSHKAFTVIPPNPKKRREIQRKAEAELAALEALRLSRAMAYVSINPSRVGGCMSLEEVRSKQQQEMMQAKRKQKPVKTQLMEETPVASPRVSAGSS
ncbi:uncharacterized protein zgc:194621 isoform X2 [Larimichthys crocea]|uniref:uncharacterized protein zgc:194621 isoform X2 n=1 Tax=Larimichthys crocea TaxID=215358 RepID=UPI000F5DE1CF|nr:uncharacterized protein LOC104933879 isoform X2 [Larimichthys crocea]